jgi:hypothetical protein
MKHIQRISKQVPAPAVEDNFLTYWGKTPGLPLPLGPGFSTVTFTEWGDWVGLLAGKFESLPIVGNN